MSSPETLIAAHVMAARLGAIRHTNGLAGQESYTVPVTYPGEAPSTVTFVGRRCYGGPVVMVTDAGQTFVTDPGRFGTFGAEWVRRFFTDNTPGGMR